MARDQGFTPALASERFLSALRGAGLTDGWIARPIDTFGRKWEPRSTHEAVFVEGEFPGVSLVHGTYVSMEASEFHTFRIAAASLRGRTDVGDLLMRDSTIYASPEAATALRAARLPGVALEPLLWTDEVPRSDWDAMYRTAEAWADPLMPEADLTQEFKD